MQSLLRTRIGSVWVDALELDDAVEAICRLVTARRGGAVFTPNVDHIVNAETDAELRAAYAAADLAVPDGQWVVWASRILGTPLPAKISGSDLVLPLARAAARRNLSMYLLGATPGVVAEAARRLEGECGVRICGGDSPQVDLAVSDDALLDRIAAAKADLLLVALGSPKQEIWIHRNFVRLRPMVMLGVGGALDFLAGRVRRAPTWMSRAGLEWVFRLAMEPRRLARRYLLNDPRFVAVVLRTLQVPLGDRAVWFSQKRRV